MMNFSQPLPFLLATLFLFAVILGRYFLVSALAYIIFYRWNPSRWQERKLGKRAYTSAQLYREIRWSTISTGIFALAGAGLLVLWQRGLTSVYTDTESHAWWWMPLSLGVAMFLHEAAYYWLHRWMHLPGVYRIVHRVHHESSIPSSFTAFAFHPLEGLLQALILPIILVLVPMHTAVILFYLTVMTLSAVINHLDIEVYPAKFHQHPVGRWLIGATHHSMHHKQHHYHFGLFFTFWDRWAGTEHPQFNARFEKATNKRVGIESTKDNV